MGYEMYRLLSSRRAFPIKPKKSKKKTTEPEVIDVEEEDMNKTLMIGGSSRSETHFSPNICCSRFNFLH